ncbi:MAG: glucoamylase family protein [Bacteroidota bacterium]
MLRLLALLLLAAPAGAQTTLVFDENDAEGDDYYAASEGAAVGDAALALAGPDGRRMPIASGDAASGADYGELVYRRAAQGMWAVVVGAPGFGPLDLSAADSVVVFLNGPAGVPGVSLPTLALQDADGDRTVGVSLDFGTRVGLARNDTGFLAGSTTDLSLTVDYLDSLPGDLARPGYPESIRIAFADAVVSESTPSIGFPARPARFTVRTEGGADLAFRFVDADEDGTLSQAGEAIEILTPAPNGGGLRQTWRIEAQNTPGTRPTAGDDFRLAVFNSGTDDDPATWQRRALSVAEFGPLGDVDATRIVGVVFANAEAATTERTLWIDAVSAISDGSTPAGPAPPTAITTEAGRGTVVLRWAIADDADGVVIYRQRPGGPYVRITPDIVRFDEWFDLTARDGEPARYILRSVRNNGLGPPLLGADSAPVEATADASAPDPYIDALARTAFDYFWEQTPAGNGLVPDRVRPTGPSASSIAAVGFGLSAYTVGADRGWITRTQAAERTLATLRFFDTCPQGPASSGTCGHRGFFYHFLTRDGGVRAGTNELSTIDTALLLGGILHAAQYFDGAGADEAEIRETADRIWRRVDWQWATPRDPLVALGWRPESGFIGFDWIGYNEAMILYIMGLGSPTFPLADDAWDGWTARYDQDWQTHYGLSFLTFPPLFGHQYSHIWVDFRNMQDDYMRGRGSTYFENSVRATLAQRAYAEANPRRFPNYSAEEWGITASDYPGGYIARGAPPIQNDDGTLVPTAPGGSYAFTPELSREALRTMYREHYARLWGPYGLKDAYNVEESWVASDYIGIDQGPIVLMIENARTGAIWDAFMTHPDIRRGMERAGFDVPAVDADPADVPALSLAAPAPNPTAGPVRLAYTLAEAGDARLAVFDILGRELAVLHDGPRQPGSHVADWPAGVAAGVYVVRLEAAGEARTRSFVVAR